MEDASSVLAFVSDQDGVANEMRELRHAAREFAGVLCGRGLVLQEAAQQFFDLSFAVGVELELAARRSRRGWL